MLAARLMTLLRQNPLTIHTSMADVYHHTTMRGLCRHLSAKSPSLTQSTTAPRSQTLAQTVTHGVGGGGSACNLSRLNVNVPESSSSASASEPESADSLRQRGRLDAPSASITSLSSMTPSTNASAGSTAFHPDSISIDTGLHSIGAAAVASSLDASFATSTDRAFWLTGALQVPSILLLLSIGMWSQLVPWAAAASVLESEWLRDAVASISASSSEPAAASASASALTSSLAAPSWPQSLWFLCIVPVAAAMVASIVFQIWFALVAIAAKWILIGTVPTCEYRFRALFDDSHLVPMFLTRLDTGRYRCGSHPLWSWFYFRWWLVNHLIECVPTAALRGSFALVWFYRALGARIGSHAHIATNIVDGFDLVEIGAHATIGADAQLNVARVENGRLILGRIRIGQRCYVGVRAAVVGGAREPTIMQVGDWQSVSAIEMKQFLTRDFYSRIPSHLPGRRRARRTVGSSDRCTGFARPLVPRRSRGRVRHCL